jgi:hypothetical protein
VAGGVTFSAATPQTTRFYLRPEGCGTSTDNPHLSTTSRTDAGDGCGLIVNAVVGLGGDVDQNAFVDSRRPTAFAEDLTRGLGLGPGGECGPGSRARPAFLRAPVTRRSHHGGAWVPDSF